MEIMWLTFPTRIMEPMIEIRSHILGEAWGMAGNFLNPNMSEIMSPKNNALHLV